MIEVLTGLIDVLRICRYTVVLMRMNGGNIYFVIY